MEDGLYELFEYIRTQRAIDFNSYRPGTIQRRLHNRLVVTGMPDYASYLKYLMENAGEFDALIDCITIKVSRFFRNPLVFEILGEIVLPELFDTFKNDVLRIWCAGCAKGEEPYSIAMLLKEVIGKEALDQKIFIIGTDIDRAALEDARKAEYSPESIAEVKKMYLDRYYVFKEGLFRLKDEIRNMVTFAFHDVTTGTTPKEGIFSDYHIILCRNVLIYLNREGCERALRGFTGFVSGNGYLVLGEAEAIIPQLMNDYEEVMGRTKIYKKK